MANKEKCQFGKLIIDYINHVILENGMVVDLKKKGKHSTLFGA